MNIDNYGIILLARFSSSRLPGKALMEIKGKPILKYIIDRLMVEFNRDQIAIATSEEKSDNVIEYFSRVNGIECYRGSLSNVAQRFLNASEKLNLDYAIRITGDSLFIDPNIIKKMLSVDGNTSYDLISNRYPKTFPTGQTVEIINTDSYKNFYTRFSEPGDFEHVTQYYYNNEIRGNINIYHFTNPDGDFGDVDMAIDTKEDFEIAQKVISNLGDKVYQANYKRIIEEYEKEL